MSGCLCASWEYVPSCLATGWIWRFTMVAAFHPRGQEWPWGKRDPCGGQNHSVTSNSTQLQSAACNKTISCPEELHRSGTHCWLLFFLNCSPPNLFDSLRFVSQKRQWKLAPTSSLCASHESSCKQCSEKVIKVWRDHHKTEPSESHHLLSAANCNYRSGYGTDRHSFLLQNCPFGKLVESP